MIDPGSLPKVLAVFAGILLATRLRIPLGLGLLGGGVALRAWSGAAWPTVGRDLLAALGSSELWLLVLNVALIMELGRYLSAGRNAEAVMAAAGRWAGRHGRAAALVALPAVIGLVPMPGGALFSAPLVGQAAREETWRPAWKSAVNFWFRHVWEFWWPLYPAVIVTVSVFDVPFAWFVGVQVPFTVLAAGVGYGVLIRPHLDELARAEPPVAGAGARALLALAPVAVATACALALPGWTQRALPAATPQVQKMAALLAGLLAALAMIVWDERRDPYVLFRDHLSRRSLGVLATLVGVMAFKSLLDASGLLPQAGRDLLASGTPVFLVIALLPFVAGMVTGVAIGFAAPAFPLLAGLLALPGTTLTPLATVVLAYLSGYAGMMLSPVHLCLVLTREHFGCSYRQVLPLLAPCVAIVWGAAAAMYIVLHTVRW